MAASSAPTALPHPMSGARRIDSPARAEPARRAPRCGPLAGLAVRAHDAVLRAVRAGDCCSASWSRSLVRRAAGAREVRPRRSSSTNVWNPVTSDFGALAPIYGTLVTSADRAADRRAGELRHRAVPDRDVPGVAQAAARHRGRAARRDPVDHLRHVGAVRVRAAVRRLRAAAADRDVRRPAGSSGRCSRARPTASACCRRASSCRS